MGLSLVLQIGISLVEMWETRSAQGKARVLTFVESEEETREGLNNSRFRLTSTQNIGNLTDHCLKVLINQTFPR